METVIERRLKLDARRLALEVVSAIDAEDIDTACAKACDAYDQLRTLKGRMRRG